MKVRLSTAWEDHEADDVVDLDPSLANGLVNGGWAVPVDDDKAAADADESKSKAKRSS